MSCGVGRRRGSDPALLWLWCRPAATAPIRPLAWEPPHAAGLALKSRKRKEGEKEVLHLVLILKKLHLFVCLFLVLHQWHMEVPRLGVKSQLEPAAYITATGMQDPSCVYNLHHTSQQRWILT